MLATFYRPGTKPGTIPFTTPTRIRYLHPPMSPEPRRRVRALIAALDNAYPAALFIAVAVFLVWVFDYFRSL